MNIKVNNPNINDISCKNTSKTFGQVVVSASSTVFKEVAIMSKNIQVIAHKIGVEIIFEGELPQTEKEQRVIYALLRESLNNMIKHAGGHYLYIEIDNSGEDVQICLHNDGEIPKQKIEEKGGLRNLRMMVESIDGEFRIESFPIFAIYVTLKKEKVWRK